MKEEILFCTSCDYKTTWESTLKHHIKFSHIIFPCADKLETYKCVLCSYETHLKVHFSAHIKELHNIENITNKSLENSAQEKCEEFKCRHCDFASCSKFLLSKHKVESHIEYYFKNRQIGSKLLECGQCSYRGYHTGNFKRHLLYMHGSFNNFICEYCGKAIRRYSDFKIHLDNHGEKLNFVRCKYCSYSGTRRNLQQHVNRIHLDKLPISKRRASRMLKTTVCGICSYVAKNRENFKRHIISAHADLHPVNWFNCEHCDYRSKFKADFREHYRHKHASDEEVTWYKCDKCAYKTKKKSHLSRHKRRKTSCTIKSK